MTSPRKVVWHEGLLMSPHHLQRADRYHEENLRARLSILRADSWGVIHAEFDETSLHTGQVLLASFAGLLPDGTYLSLGDGHGCASRSLEGAFPKDLTSLDVYIALPRERDGLRNYDRDHNGNGRGARFRVVRKNVPDLAGTGEPIDIELALPQPVLLFGTESRDDYDCIKIGELVRDATGVARLSQDFVPPCLQLGASPVVRRWLEQLVSTMTNRRRALVAASRERDGHMAAFDAIDVTRFLMLNAINGFIPLMSHFLQSPGTPPRELYQALLQLKGQLSSFVTESVQGDPRFEHSDLRATFEPLFADLERLLKQTAREDYLALRVHEERSGLYAGDLSHPDLKRYPSVFVAIRFDPKTDRSELMKLPMLCKIAAPDEMNALLSSALNGAALHVVHRPPPEIPERSDELYFQIDVASPSWRTALTTQEIAIYLPEHLKRQLSQLRLLATPRQHAPLYAVQPTPSGGTTSIRGTNS